jgi:hypothetical protein
MLRIAARVWALNDPSTRPDFNHVAALCEVFDEGVIEGEREIAVAWKLSRFESRPEKPLAGFQRTFKRAA